jgi:hypothetical protein
VGLGPQASVVVSHLELSLIVVGRGLYCKIRIRNTG